ncbi:diguanylate cyclase [Salinisphaera dokdonensis CL-ES53]|uniref:diguanylate cyclase n=1 Tax=Salinisphaera dokdonensis CL-ES53 TaxID=1304272 RepID=A0ABV2AZU7_9GAMM
MPTSDAHAAGARYAIARLLGEFADPNTEERYRKSVQHRIARHLRHVIGVWGALWLAFSLSDLHYYGAGAQYFLMLGCRVAFVGLLGGCAMWIKQKPALATDGRLITAVTILGFTQVFAVYFISADDEIRWLAALTIVLIMGVFVLVPNRTMLAVGAALYGAVGTMICVALNISETSALRMAVLALMLFMPGMAGGMAAYRFDVVRRSEFAALEQAEQEIERRRELELELRRQARTDPLTGASNRRDYEALFAQERRRAIRYGRPLSICVLDIDRFKYVNDTYGHGAGDAALVALADICRVAMRDADILGRIGGEEFVLILPETTVDDAVAFAERLRLSLAAANIQAGAHNFRLTATFGVTTLTEEDKDIADLILRADLALYAGKDGGRDQVRSN